jgi:hypothetical protein
LKKKINSIKKGCPRKTAFDLKTDYEKTAMRGIFFGDFSPDLNIKKVGK